MMQAIWLERSATSKVSIFLAPLWPPRIRVQVVSTPQPSGVTMPSPVTTTRLMSKTPAWIGGQITKKPGDRCKRSVRLRQLTPNASALRVLLEKLGGVADGQNRFRRVVRNLATELF